MTRAVSVIIVWTAPTVERSALCALWLDKYVVALQKMYLIESWIVLAGDAELARPKNGELCAPTMRVRLV